MLFRFAFEGSGFTGFRSRSSAQQPAARVAQKLSLRGEGIALRYLEIDGRWEDHVRYALTAEEWVERRDRYSTSGWPVVGNV